MSQSRPPTSDVPGGHLTRRSLFGACAGVAVAAIAGCRGDDAEPTPTVVIPSGSPVAVVPSFDDPTRWAGRTLRVAAWGSEVQAALSSTIWQPFARATGCTVQEMATDYAQLASSVAA